ncbi:MAG: hypothetical protein M1832_004164 [Thelocarpon impressellum]|nr:MAG: hypothetical protein M1832_004164 [Thelocarpon impressellum]
MARGLMRSRSFAVRSGRDLNGPDRGPAEFPVSLDTLVFKHSPSMQPHLPEPHRRRTLSRSRSGRERLQVSPRINHDLFYSPTAAHPAVTQVRKHSDIEWERSASRRHQRKPTAAEDIGRAITCPSDAAQEVSPWPRDNRTEKPARAGSASTTASGTPRSDGRVSRRTSDGEPKVSRWKSLGSLFGRRVPPMQSPACGSPRQSPVLGRRGSSRRVPKTGLRSASPSVGRPLARARSKSSSEKSAPPPGVPEERLSPIHRAVDPSLLSPVNVAPPPTPPKAPSKPPTLQMNKAPVELPGDSPKVPDVQVWAPPKLNIDIPSVELERYSVMFGDLLQPHHQSSLLARRHANLEKLKPRLAMVEQLETPKTPPSVYLKPTTPAPSSKSPSFSLFPTAPSSADKERARDNLRSQPAKSPLSRTVSNPVSPKSAIYQYRHQEIKSPSQFVFMLRSPAETNRRSPRVLSKWSTDTSCLSPTSSIDSMSHFSRPEVSPSMRQLPPMPPAKLPSRLPLRSPHSGPDESEALIRSAAELSIQRQISVSQRQRQLLIPVVPRRPSDRVVEQQRVHTPTLVEHSPAEARKSQIALYGGF